VEPTKDNLRVWEERRGRVEEPGLPEAVRRALPEVRGLMVLHLGCGTGVGTLELVERGAMVTGVDPSPAALEAARERLPDTALIAAELDELPVQLGRGRFDLALAPVLVDPRRVVAALRPGGELLIHDVHPVVECLDAALRWRANYFEEGERRLGEIVTAVAQAGLVISSLEELPAEDRRRQDPRVPAEFVLRAQKPPRAAAPATGR
jgi:SAM-dependent methyltransferase